MGRNTWERGRKKKKKIYSDRFRKLTIKRLENNEFPFFDTKIERRVAKGLIKRKIPFIKQFKIQNKFVCDFAIPCFKIIIECDGDYWHANPKIYANRNLTPTQEKKIRTDKLKDKFLKKQGWTVLRFFETDIKSNVSSCVDKIEKKVKSKLEELKKIPSPIDNL